MQEKIFLHLLILCGIWSPGIIGTFADEENKQSADFLVRQKRVVSYLEGEDIPVRIHDAPYVVNIQEKGRLNCVGNILSLYVVITAASCCLMTREYYTVLSSNARLAQGREHNVAEIRKRIGDPHYRTFDGVSLLIVNPPFEYTPFSIPIRLHLGPLLIGSFGTVHGWGFNYRSENRGTNFPKRLRSIEVPVISHQNCVDRYRPHLELSNKTVCTYHPQRHCGHSDKGAGLVVDGTLAGIFLWSGLVGQVDPRYPDVYVSLHDPQYNQWIRTNVQSIDLRFQNLHQ